MDVISRGISTDDTAVNPSGPLSSHSSLKDNVATSPSEPVVGAAFVIGAVFVAIREVTLEPGSNKHVILEKQVLFQP